MKAPVLSSVFCAGLILCLCPSEITQPVTLHTVSGLAMTGTQHNHAEKSTLVQTVVSRLHGRKIPLWLKLAYTLFVCLIVPLYWREYGPTNFLWFSDLALLLTLPALWLESRLLVSMMALSVLLLELAWNVDFFGRLLTGVQLTALSRYMFNHTIPLFVRALSLFHIVLPPLLLWLVARLGYDRRALIAQTLFAWLVLPITYLSTSPARNIHWVFRYGHKPQTLLPAP